VAHAEELDLQTILNSMIDDSRRNCLELIREIHKLGGEAGTQVVSVSARIYQTWMDFKSAIFGYSREVMFQSSQYLETASQKVYRHAISSNEIPTEIRQLLRNEQSMLAVSSNLIKEYRDRLRYRYPKSYQA